MTPGPNELHTDLPTSESNEAPTELSLCMIVRDSARTLGACLAGIRPWVDEIIVVDTGSNDHTREIAMQHGARLYEFSWCNDFAAARNESIRHARGEWILWMDSDDTIDESNGRQLREVIQRSADPTTLGYIMQVHCPGDDGRSDVTVVDHVKLFRNRPDVRFEGRIHEQVLPSIRRAGGDIDWTDLFVVHSGVDHSPAARQKKRQRDLDLLELELREQPDHPFVLFNLGMTYADAGQHAQAIVFLQRCIAVSEPRESHLRKAFAILTSSLARIDRVEAAWDACEEGLENFPKDVELLFRHGILAHRLGRNKTAIDSYRQVLSNDDERAFYSRDRDLIGFKTHHNLAIVYEDLGQLEQAATHWKKVLEDSPSHRDAWRALKRIIFKNSDLQAAEALADEWEAVNAMRELVISLRAETAMKRGRPEIAIGVLSEAVRRTPHDVTLRHALCEILFEHGTLQAAEQAIQELAELDPNDGATWHNLGSVQARQGRHPEAVDSFQASLNVRPNSAVTHLQLGYVLSELEQHAEAASAWGEAARIAPTTEAGKAACQRLSQFQQEIISS